jgi:hypothetical protein
MCKKVCDPGKICDDPVPGVLGDRPLVPIDRPCRSCKSVVRPSEPSAQLDLMALEQPGPRWR